MSQSFDVYRHWLGVQETARPLNHYQLLRLKPFEDDTAKIREHYRKMNAHVRKFAAGERSQEAHALLGELSRALLCLTDASRKQEYDASLGRASATAPQRRSFEELLVARGVVDQARLDKARQYAAAVGLDLHDALIQQRTAAADQVYPLYAESLGLPFVELKEIPLDGALLAKMPASLARQHSCAPILVDDGHVLIASPNVINPSVEGELRLRLNMPVRTVLCTSVAIDEVIARHYSREAAAAETAAGPLKSGQGLAQASSGAGPAPIANSAEVRKRRKMLAFVAFNIVFMTYQLFFSEGPFFKGLAMAIALGAAAGAAVYGLLTALKK